MTFKEAQDKIFRALQILGWGHSDPSLNVRWCQPPMGGAPDVPKVWFKPESLHKGQDRPVLSLWINPKEIAGKAPGEIERLIMRQLGYG